MPVANGTVIIKGIDWDDPSRICTKEELVDWINEIGFLPMFSNNIPGFSMEEHISPRYWQTGDKEHDPWEWRKAIAESGEVVYGKFFDKKSGFISLKWFPYFANYRRNGLDFEYAWENGYETDREKLIMDVFDVQQACDSPDGVKRLLLTSEIKKRAGFVKRSSGIARNFHWTTVDLMMKTYIVTAGFRKKRNKKGGEYGIDVAALVPPEDIWGYEMVTAAYDEAPCDSLQRIIHRTSEVFPGTTEDDVICMLG